MRGTGWLAVVLVTCVAGIELSWIPADGDGPLPMSAKYRDALDRLCVLDQEGSLPSSIPKDKQVAIRKQCVKLRKAGSASVPDSISSVAGVVLMIGGALFFFVQSRKPAGATADPARPASQATAEQQDAARQARLERFTRPELSAQQQEMLSAMKAKSHEE
jgi:hypothetical protein